YAQKRAINLRGRVIHFRGRRQRKIFRTHVAGDAYDLPRNRRNARDQTAADRVFAGEKFLGHRLVDDDSLRRAGTIAPIEVAPLLDRNAKRCKESRRNRRANGNRAIADGWKRPSFYGGGRTCVSVV